MAPPVLPDFLAWMSSVGIHHSDAIQLVDAAPGCSGRALGVRAARDVAEGERLCTIPKAACLSIRTSQLADVIEAEELGGGLGLVVAVMHEMSLGPDSRWHGYFRALPTREYLPLFWSGEELALLQGTELERSVEADREAAAEDFREHVAPLLAKYQGRLRAEGCTLPAFQVAASFVASRAFGVDEWHGDAMVPLADAFNHKASVVELGAGYEVHGAQSDSDSDSDSGGEDDRENGSSEGEEEGESSGQEEEEDACSGSRAESEGGAGDAHAGASCQQGRQHSGPGCCGRDDVAAEQVHGEAHANGGRQQGREQRPAAGGASVLPSVMAGAQASIYGFSSANGLHLRLEMGIVDADADTLEIVAASAVPRGAEVHNTYGELGNAELVKKYGFALRQNPFTAVGLDKAALLADAAAALGPTRWRARSKLLRDGSEVLEEDEEPFEALPNGHISPALFVALRVLCAADEEAAGWDDIGAALRLPPSVPALSSESGGHGSEEEAEQPELGAVQVWQVVDADGSPLPWPEAQADPAQQRRAAEEEEAEQLGGGSAQRYAALLNSGMCELVQRAVKRRLEAYRLPPEPALQQLEAADAPGGAPGGDAQEGAAVAASERRAARRAALLLAVTEREVLRDLLAALERRLAALGGEQEAGQEQGAQQRAAKRQPQAHQQQGSGKARKRAEAEPGQGGSNRRQRRR